jgi:hypothetical protein
MRSSRRRTALPAILRNDFKRLMEDIESIENDMETLKRDYSAWCKDIQNIDLGNITRHARELEWNLNMTISDCAVACRQYWKEYNFPVAEGLGRSSAYMECICSGLENMKKGFHEGDIRFSLFKDLCVDWEEFKKSICHTQRLVNKHQERRKNFHWLTENDEERSQ